MYAIEKAVRGEPPDVRLAVRQQSRNESHPLPWA